MRKSILDALFPKTRQVVLEACLLHPERWWYLSDLATHLHLTPSSLQRELASLKEVRLLDVRKEGNRVYYKANLACPGALELQALFIKTSGVTDVVRAVFKGVQSKVDFAFIYGSLARGELRASSDIDVMVVGRVKLTELVTAINKAERTLGRELNATLYSRREFFEKARSDDAFIKTVLKGEKIFLKGNDDELESSLRTG